MYVFGTPKANEGGFWKIQTVVAPHDENKVIKEQRSLSTNVPRKDSAYDSRKIQYNCVKNSTKSNLLNLHYTNLPDLSILLFSCFFYYSYQLKVSFIILFFSCTVVYVFFYLNERQFSS